ncbi:oligosaccharide flippase family protein [Opitutus terrae]|uniref:Polysaccharide biosynthesis protein n=1 Tax=Opitutus terrae (strain DSM 11246 / JCM 15787 / PB90-1) TaxID=452637 RepID=B1ZV68_OPITP|nr:polysaccharide biosynthesis protein [Opitutus terrae PB90-1]
MIKSVTAPQTSTAACPTRQRGTNASTQVRNFTALMIVQAANLVAPLCIYPYALRALGADVYGKYANVNALALIVSLVADFGTTTTGPREVATARDDPSELRATTSALVKLRLFLAILAAIAVNIYYLYSEDLVLRTLGQWSSLLVLSCAVFPLWYYQGREQLMSIALSYGIARIASIGAIYLCVSDASDYGEFYAISLAPQLLVGVVFFVILIRHSSLTLQSVTSVRLSSSLKLNWRVALAASATAIKDRGPVALTASVLSFGDIAKLDFGSKIVELVASVSYNITRAVYPSFCARPDTRRLAVFVYSGVATGCIVSACLAIGSETIASLVGGVALAGAGPLLGVMGWALPGLIASSFIGHLGLLAHRQDGWYFTSVLLSSLAIVALLAGAVLAFPGNATKIAWTVVLGSVGEAVLRFAIARRSRAL